MRGYKLSIGPNPLTPILSPMGRGSPAVPQFTAVLAMQALRQRERDMLQWTFLSTF